jgi:hypothetical protein
MLPRHQLCRQQIGSTANALQENEMRQLQGYAAWALLRVGADFDVELLLWPGGSLIAALLWAGAGVGAALRAAARLGATWSKPQAGKKWLQNALRYGAAGLNAKRRRARAVRPRERCLGCGR